MTVSNFDTSTSGMRLCQCEETLKSSIESAKKICFDSDSNDNEPEIGEKTLKFPTIRVAIEMVDELKQSAQDSLEDEEVVISLNSVWRLLREKLLQRLNQKNVNDYFLRKRFRTNTLFVESYQIY